MQLSRNTILVIAAVVLVVGVVVFYFGLDRDERAIRGRLNTLVELVEKEGKVSQFEALGRSRKFKDLFAESAFVEYLPGESLPVGAEAMQSGFLSVWSQIDSASIRISQHEIEVDTAREAAVSSFYARSSVVMNGSQKMADTVFYRCYWIKIEGEWHIERIVAEKQG